MVAQDKWDKAKAQVEEVIAMIYANPDRLDRKQLEQVQGFLQYLTQTYSGITQYITEFDLTIDGWRESRMKDGWQRKDNQTAVAGDGGAQQRKC